MEQDLSALEARLERLLDVVRKLSEHNQALRVELEQTRTHNAAMRARMGEARSRVQAVLDRLPVGEAPSLSLGLPADPAALEAVRAVSAH